MTNTNASARRISSPASTPPPATAAANPGENNRDTTNVEQTSHYLSAVEFLQSGCMPSAIFLLEQEEKPTAQGAAAESVVNDNSKKRTMENAVRLALLLTKSFVNFMSDQDNGGDSQPRNASSIVLEDVYIHFVREAAPTTRPQEEQVQQGLFWANFDGKNEVSDQDYLNSMSRRRANSITPVTDGIVILRGVDIISREMTNNEADPQEQLGVPSQKMQVLGKILYSFFCLGQPLPSDIFGTPTPSPSPQANTDEADDLISKLSHDSERSRKSLRISEKTVFTRLIDNGFLPKSICRFLADMIDIDGTSNTKSTEDSSSFVSFEDVILDLEQMISQPQMFLHHDSQDGNFSTPLESQSQSSSRSLPMLGQKYHSRRDEVATLMNLADQIMEEPSSQNLKGVQAAFISGIAGSGKSTLFRAVGENLSSLSGWIVIKAKFERSVEHASRGIFSSMFNGIVSYLVEMKESPNPEDVAYSKQASKSILDSVGYDTLSGLVDFLPSLPQLFDNIGKSANVQAEEGDWQLIHSLTRILVAVLESPGRYIMICCDDLQWADKTSLSLISEVLINIGGHGQIGHSCLFVGVYRSDAIDDDHPFSIQYLYLQMSSDINVTEIMLSSLSKEDIVGILMAEFQLPRRLVRGLADVVFKKTAGHVLFVVELLNSMIRDSIVAYSSEKCQYTWDDDRINFIQTGACVAEFIAGNLKSLDPESLQMLQILSCFGTQMDDSLLQILERFHKGIVYSIDISIEAGILDRAGPIVIFTHDLIQEAAYESMSLEERKSLHLSIGQFLGSVNASLEVEPVVNDGLDFGQCLETSNSHDFGQLTLNDQVFFSGRNMTSTLSSISCDQVNAAGSCSISDTKLNAQFAKWNLSAGQSFASQSNFSAALHYYTNGIAFLGQEYWFSDLPLCLELHRGAVLSSFAIGEFESVGMYAQKVIDRVLLADSLDVQRILLKSLTQSGRHQECISKSIGILKLFGFHIPLAPSKESIGHALVSTAVMASQYSSDQIARLCQKTTNDSAYSAVKIMDACYVSLVITASPFLPLIVCEVVKFSFQNGFCPEAAMSFAIFAKMNMTLKEDFSAGRHWADLTREMIKSTPNKNKNSEVRAEILLHNTIEVFFNPPRDISYKLMTCYHDAMKIGQVDDASMSLVQVWGLRLLGGYNLSLILKSFEGHFKFIAKHSNISAKYMALDGNLLMKLTGKTIDFFAVLKDSISSLDDLRSEAESSKDIRWLHNFQIYQMLIAYWRGDYISAEEHFNTILAHPSMAKNPGLLSIYQTFFGGIVAFHLHRQAGGKQDERLKRGKEMMDTLEKWTKNSMTVFENKWLLLQAEYSASIGEHDKARLLYKSSINVAKDHGNIHELGLAHELLGDHHFSTHGSYCADSNECFRKACVYYKQWGATAVAERCSDKIVN